MTKDLSSSFDAESSCDSAIEFNSLQIEVGAADHKDYRALVTLVKLFPS